LLYLPWVTSSIFFVSVEFTLLSCLFYSLFNPELAFEGVVKEYKNKVITLFISPLCQIFVGDKYSILAGCDKTFSMCKSKFNNTVNFRGEPYIPGFYS
jgi:uncharacterized phage protein (TIGR02218 family)